MVVKLTQKQADYLETFKENERAIHYISRWGWSYPLLDGNGKVYGKSEKEPFKQDEKLKMFEAIINGYEVIEPKFKFYNFSDSSGGTALYYAGKANELMNYFKIDADAIVEEIKARFK